MKEIIRHEGNIERRAGSLGRDLGYPESGGQREIRITKVMKLVRGSINKDNVQHYWEDSMRMLKHFSTSFFFFFTSFMCVGPMF